MKRLEIDGYHGNTMPRQIYWAAQFSLYPMLTSERIVECLVSAFDEREGQRITAPVGIYPPDYPRLLDSLVAGELARPSVRLTLSKINRSDSKGGSQQSCVAARIEKRWSKLSADITKSIFQVKKLGLARVNNSRDLSSRSSRRRSRVNSSVNSIRRDRRPWIAAGLNMKRLTEDTDRAPRNNWSRCTARP